MKTTSSRPSRRSVLVLGGAALAVALPGPAAASRSAARDVDEQLRGLEREHSTRLGVFAVDTRTCRTVAHRADERFPICSVAKTVAVAAVLRDSGGASLNRRIHYTEPDVTRAGYAPITGQPENLATGMTVEALCAAAIAYSDNAAMNLLLRQLGGPAAVTRFCRSIGDTTTRLDRWEPDLNSAEPGRVTDTTSPHAIARTYQRFTLGHVLDTADRDRITGWLLANTTGDKRLRAGLPAGWRAAEKTGSGAYGTTNDVGIVWPPGRAAIVLAVLSTKQDADAPADEPLLARTASVVATALSA